MAIKHTKIGSAFFIFLFSTLSPTLSARNQSDLESALQFKINAHIETDIFEFFSREEGGIFALAKESPPNKSKYLKRNEADRTYRFEEFRSVDPAPVAFELFLKESFLFVRLEQGGQNSVDIIDASQILAGVENIENHLQNLVSHQAELPILLSFPITKEKESEAPPLSTVIENISKSAGADTLYSFLPWIEGKDFYLIKAVGADGIVIDHWGLTTEMSVETAMRQFQRGKLGAPTRTRMRNVTHPSPSGRAYEISARDNRGKLSKALHAIYGLTSKDDFIAISTPQGIDYVRRSDLLLAHRQNQEDIQIQKTIPLPFATGIVFLDSLSPRLSKDELKLTSQWNPVIGESELTLFSDESPQPINHWTLNAPMLGLAKSSSYQLFSPGGIVGIHYFKIDPHEATIRAEFIKRDSTLDPRYYSVGEAITGIWVSNSSVPPTLHFSLSSSSVRPCRERPCGVRPPAILESPIEQTIQQARRSHRAAIAKAIDTPFTFTQGGKAFLNGLLASIPFDADKLVDVFGFDLEKSLDEQLKAHEVADILTGDEKNEIRDYFTQLRNSGEIIGSAGQVLFAMKKMAEFRRLRFQTRAEQAKRMNDIRRNLGLAAGDLTASGAPWLPEWKSAELWVGESKIAAFREQLAELLKLPQTKILPPERLREILRLIEKTRSYERPFERVWVEIGHAPPVVQKLEYWEFKQLSKFFESVQVVDFVEALSLDHSLIQEWGHLTHLNSLKELSQFQKLEMLALTAKIKSALMQGIARIKELGQPPSNLIKALKKLQSRAGIAQDEIETLSLQIKNISDQIEKSEEAYRLTRIIELNQPAQELTHLEKIEKLKQLLRCGWTGNAGKLGARWSPGDVPLHQEGLLKTLDEIYDHEQMLQSTFTQRMFKHGKLGEAALFTLYSDAANVGIEWWVRKNDGRPLLSSGLAHNLFFNTYIMLPIFASNGFRLKTAGKLFILVFNAASTGYMNQKFVKFGAELLDTETPYQRWHQQWDGLTPYEKATFLLPPPRRPLLDTPAYMMKSIFSRPGEDHNGWYSLYDSSFTLGLSTPRGILISRLGNYLSSRALLDNAGRHFLLARRGARFGPVIGNETVGAAVYTPIYGYFFEESDHKPIVLDSKLETIDPWSTDHWEQPPKLRLSLTVKSSTPLEDVTFFLISNDTKLDVKIPETQWKERREQLYELVWEKEISPSEEPTIYIAKNLTLKNKDRWLGDALMPWREKIHEKGGSVEVENPLMTWVQGKETFTQGLLKVFLSLSKEATSHYQNQRGYLAAGIVYMIAQYLEPFYRELVVHEKTDHFILDVFKEGIRLTKSLNYSDDPIEGETLQGLVQYFEKLSLEWGLNNLIPFKEESDNPLFQRSWIDFHSLKIVPKIREEILEETRTAWLVLDEGDKNDWNTFQIFKGYAYALLKLYRWYHYHFNEGLSQTNRDAITHCITTLEELKDFGQELERSWVSNLGWSDQYLKGLAEKFKELELSLSFGVKRDE